MQRSQLTLITTYENPSGDSLRSIGESGLYTFSSDSYPSLYHLNRIFSSIIDSFTAAYFSSTPIARLNLMNDVL